MKDISENDVRNNIPLVTRKDFKREVRAGSLELGGDRIILMAGPCTVESREQVVAVAKAVKEAGATMLRGGVFKPLTFPYGDPLLQPDRGSDRPAVERTRVLGRKELFEKAERRFTYFKEAGQKYGLPIISEILYRDAVDMMSQHVDMFQIGYRHMFNMDLIEKKDTNIHRTLERHRGVPVFSNVELNLIAACTRRCPFCPASDPQYYRLLYSGVTPKYLTMDLYLKVLEDLQKMRHSGDVSYSGFSEPLLHPRLEDLIRLTKERLISARIVVTSNGDLISEAKIRALCEAGADEIVISVYDGEAQLSKLQRIIRRSGAPEERILFRKRYAIGGDYGFSISNRCGLVDVKAFNRTEEPLPLEKKCYYPFNFIKVDLDGDVLYCPHNWIKRNTVGNAKEDSIWEIWTGTEFESIRRSLSRADRTSLPCSLSDVEGTRSGHEGYVAWKTMQTT